ncbi:MAG: UMP kinase [Sedimentisphaerales bacterium]|nr:UMP kinase [Sedimentisphaerales bacterium]MBN2844040.1 UMP kinase [Sedimentisphaerales bacterium]
MSDKLKYKRVLLKISGEGLSGGGIGLEPKEINAVCEQIAALSKAGLQVALVCGAGNIVRGATLNSKTTIERVTADQMGMLATVINSLALQDVLTGMGAPAVTLSAVEMFAVCDRFTSRRAKTLLNEGKIVVLAGGTGNPFFTTDTCAALRAVEIDADVVIKATKVDGVYTADPMKDPSARLYQELTFDQVIKDDLKVMDHSAITLCKENHIDIIVCNLMKPGMVENVVKGGNAGTRVTNAG